MHWMCRPGLLCLPLWRGSGAQHFLDEFGVAVAAELHQCSIEAELVEGGDGSGGGAGGAGIGIEGLLEIIPDEIERFGWRGGRWRIGGRWVGGGIEDEQIGGAADAHGAQRVGFLTEEIP